MVEDRDKSREERQEECACLLLLLPPPPGVDSSGKGTAAGACAAAHSPAPALPHIIGLPTMLHTTRTLNKQTNNLGIRFDATTTIIILQFSFFLKKK